MKKAIINAELVMRDHLIPEAMLLIEDGRIADFGEMRGKSVPEGCEVVDAQGLYVGPGLIDIHTHASDKLFFTDDPVGAAQHHLRHGVTTLLPALYFSMDTPEYIRSITKVGNIEFEGDYRFETEGSNFIVEKIMDDDPRPLVIQHWGGINTTVRALYTIYERYHGTPEWESVLAKVVGKVRIGGNGEDNCRADSKIDEMFPGLQSGGYGFGFFNYGSFFSASKNASTRAAEELQPYMHAPWNLEAYKQNHGKLPEQIWLMAEGRAIYGEPIIYNYGLIDYMDWGLSADLGWGPESLKSRPRADYEPYSWAFCQFGCASFIDIGLRSDVNNRGNNRYTIVMWEELAARADWAICEPQDCNHAPIVKAGTLDLTAAPGETVRLSGSATDPDGDELTTRWYVPAAACTYKEGKAEGLAVSSETGWNTSFTVPSDARPGDKLVVTLEVRDNAERPMTRYAQYVIVVS